MIGRRDAIAIDNVGFMAEDMYTCTDSEIWTSENVNLYKGDGGSHGVVARAR